MDGWITLLIISLITSRLDWKLYYGRSEGERERRARAAEANLSKKLPTIELSPKYSTFSWCAPFPVQNLPPPHSLLLMMDATTTS